MLWITRHYLLSEVSPGMILARPVLSNDRNVLLNENTVLTETMLFLLATWGIQSLYIKDIHLENRDEVPSLVSERQSFTAKYHEMVAVLQDVFEYARSNKAVKLAVLDEAAGQAVKSLVNATGAIGYMSGVVNREDYIFHHSVNVAVVAGMIGRWLSYGDRVLKEIVLTGLLHDIGNTQLPPDLLNKHGALTVTEMELIKRHPSLGYKLIEDADIIPQSVKYGVWQHHERLDGSGYPFGLEGDEVSDYARIVAVADIYDAMTTERGYRSALTPFHVVAEVFDEMFGRLDPAVTYPFINRLRESLMGYIVRLSDGTEARVVFLDNDRLTHPVVKLANGGCIDLDKRRDLRIVEVIAS